MLNINSMLMQATRLQNHQNTIIVLTFECYTWHSTFEGSFECRTFAYALLLSIRKFFAT